MEDVDQWAIADFGHMPTYIGYHQGCCLATFGSILPYIADAARPSIRSRFISAVAPILTAAILTRRPTAIVLTLMAAVSAAKKNYYALYLPGCGYGIFSLWNLSARHGAVFGSRAIQAGYKTLEEAIDHVNLQMLGAVVPLVDVWYPFIGPPEPAPPAAANALAAMAAAPAAAMAAAAMAAASASLAYTTTHVATAPPHTTAATSTADSAITTWTASLCPDVAETYPHAAAACNAVALTFNLATTTAAAALPAVAPHTTVPPTADQPTVAPPAAVQPATTQTAATQAATAPPAAALPAVPPAAALPAVTQPTTLQPAIVPTAVTIPPAVLAMLPSLPPDAAAAVLAAYAAHMPPPLPLPPPPTPTTTAPTQGAAAYVGHPCFHPSQFQGFVALMSTSLSVLQPRGGAKRPMLRSQSPPHLAASARPAHRPRKRHSKHQNTQFPARQT